MNQGKLDVMKQKMAEKEMANHSSILALRTKGMKRQENMTPEDESPGWKVSNMLLEKSRGQLLPAP